MIIWLASYPRSGNTLVRSMLHQAFGLRSYSIYDDQADIGALPEVAARTGHEFLPSSFDHFYALHRTSSDLQFVKTHDPPIDDSPAIYIIRDGRSAIASWYNMLVTLRKRNDITMQDIIRGQGVRFGHWSGHIRAWAPRIRPRSLLLYYEDLLLRTDQSLRSIEQFIDRPKYAPWRNDFDELHTMFPQFFHRGSDAQNISQMTAEDRSLFWQLHAECMREFGFGDSEDSCRAHM